MTAKTVNQKNHDTLLKVIALICAVLLWFYAEAQENPSKERQLTVPVHYANLAEDYVIENRNQSVQISVKGNETDIMSLRSDDFTAVVDLSEAVVGSSTYPVTVSGTAVNERFTYTPDKVNLTIDQIQTKEVAVRVRTDGTVAQYYELKYTDVQPDTVKLQGTGQHLADITDVETVVVDISGLKQDTQLQAKLNLPDGVTAQTEENAFMEEAYVTVVMGVQPIQESRTLETVIALRNIPENMSGIMESNKATMLLKGNAELLATQPVLDQLVLYVDCHGLQAGPHVLPIQVEAANEAMLNALQLVSPQTVTVTLNTERANLPENEASNAITNNNENSDLNHENNIAE